MAFKYLLTVAEFVIEFQSEEALPLEEGFVPFLTFQPATPHLVVQCMAGLPDYDFTDINPLFVAKNEQQSFYSVYPHSEGYSIVIYDQQKLEAIQQLMVINAEGTMCQLYYRSDDSHSFPLKYPFVPILLNYLTLNHDAVMMHASCAFDGERGRMFSGFSGVGKSTMSKLWWQFGCTIINDDRLMIRKEKEGGFTAHNTPMFYADVPKNAPLNALYLIYHSPENIIKPISGALAVSKVMAYSIQNNFSAQWIAKRLDFFTELVRVVPVYEYGFRPDLSAIHQILAHETGTEF